jgi:hypothetical protein
MSSAATTALAASSWFTMETKPSGAPNSGSQPRATERNICSVISSPAP